MQEWIQIVAALLMLVAFVLGQFDLLAENTWAYLCANLIGSAMMAATAVLAAQWGFLLLEGCWALVSLYGLARKLLGAPPPALH
ncbi:CBU_0592 family membrane protein [Rhodopila sp.]|uniref:CBU_0592 family membrane protein n=1 Tax=Rhodopila sp. TaxID=2480087 RepID=UPI003D0F8FFF